MEEANEPSHGSPWTDLVERAAIWVRWLGPGRIASAAGAAVLVGAFGWWLFRSPAPPTEARLSFAAHAATSLVGTSPATAAPATLSTGPATVVVHVAGEVAAPGVYELAAGSRVTDAIAAAGGSTAVADPDALNLAAPLLDGDRVAVPAEGEPAAPGAGGVTHAGGDSGGTSGPVNLNAATVAELDELPGIGPATAAAIVAHRDANGPFVAVDDLEGVRGIGPAKLDTIRPLVTV